MRNKILLAEKYRDKQEFLDKIEELAVHYGYRIVKDESYNHDDIDLYRDISDDEAHLIGFWLINEEDFSEDRYKINENDYYISIFISHNSEILNEVNILLKEILTSYPDMYVTDEAYKDFYNIRDIESGSVPEWFEV